MSMQPKGTEASGKPVLRRQPTWVRVERAISDARLNGITFSPANGRNGPKTWRFEGTEMDMWVYRIVPTHIRAFHRLNPMGFTRWNFGDQPDSD